MLLFALRNLFRNRGRTALTLGVIVSGIIALILTGGFVEDVFVQLREATIHSQLGHIQVFQKGYREHGASDPYRYVIERPAEVVRALDGMTMVNAAMARLSFTAMLNNGRTDFAVVGEGIEPDKEAALGTSMTITAGHSLGDRDKYGILLGEGVARLAKLQPGDRVTVLVNTLGGALNTVDFDVIGIFRTFSKDYDARTVRIPLRAAQELLGTQGANAIVISLKDTESTEEARRQLVFRLDGDRYEVRTWRELADFYDKTVALYQRQFGVLRGIILIAVLLSVANSVNMSVFERTGEFGTLMALGNRGMTVFRLVIIENVLLGATGAIIGALVGVGIASLISAIGIPMPPPPNSEIGYTAMIRVSLQDALTATSIGVVATVLAALLPARRIAFTPVVEALRQN